MITPEASRHHGRISIEDIQSQLSPSLFAQAKKKIKREQARLRAERASAAIQATPTAPPAPPVRCTVRVTRRSVRPGHCLGRGKLCEVDLNTDGGEEVNLAIFPVQVEKLLSTQ
jgi:hypothetical protein